MGGSSEAATLIESFGGLATGFASSIGVTQSFTTPANGTADWIQSFELLTETGDSYSGVLGTARAYLFEGVFEGPDVGVIPSLTVGGPEGLLAVGVPTQFTGDGHPDAHLTLFDFPAMAAMLQPGTLYSVTLDPGGTTMIFGGIHTTPPDRYAGGSFYTTPDTGGSNLVDLNADLSFRVTSVPIPEPSGMAMLLSASLAILLRRRRCR